MIPAITLKTVHSVGRSGMITCIGIQNGGLAVELQRHKKNVLIIYIIAFFNRTGTKHDTVPLIHSYEPFNSDNCTSNHHWTQQHIEQEIAKWERENGI